MEVVEIQLWLFQVEPLKGESLSHFLGRFRRANGLTPARLGKETGLGSAIARWEKFRFNPPPTPEQLEALAVVLGVDVDRLKQMLPPAGVEIKRETVRLCAACYVESPYHKIEWQLKVIQGCLSHDLTLLSKCPNCGAKFKTPAVWQDSSCQQCSLTFADMVKYQKSY
ncbi:MULTISPECIES: TniQ family protein [unclassified Tolypothrix]|uniref:TniQ family protein n=1 Tax=unclassified Tolypothrix TaxID=2649714 RepID=UPI0005EAB42B|nr:MULTISPECIES: TniQ family protein [unclassified Tolypothrix]BAY94950.1 hypothetical protein NIES3275_70050 [Microchaete diplosiphon NIES-3275]EKE97114.1 putative XRE family protein [Tolypothrix sp. PCC 7601]MBE9086715.1 TniQ family protein [Tolypothrix sp. LEGE 11397]UYD28587.1 TniQ family protein [Tolypothrix sp. PCC 7712]UYD35503.1 TniQ family protein [Tolypothrix sp. PCC 7601]